MKSKNKSEGREGKTHVRREGRKRVWRGKEIYVITDHLDFPSHSPFTFLLPLIASIFFWILVLVSTVILIVIIIITLVIAIIFIIIRLWFPVSQIL